MKKISVALLALQVFFIVFIASFVSIMESISKSGRNAGALAAMLSLGIMALYLASVVLSGIVASKQRRSVIGWVALAIFLPIFGPAIQSFMKDGSSIRAGASPAATLKSGASPAYIPDAGVGPDEAQPAANATGFNAEGFCAACIYATTDESPGNVRTFNGIGTTLQGTRWRSRGLDQCPTCGSVVQKKWMMFGFPIKALGTYRVLYTKKGLMSSQFYGRRLRNDSIA